MIGVVEKGNNIQGSGPHLMEDQNLLWEFFERHYFVKSMLRYKNRIIDELPRLRSADRDKRETLILRRKNSPSKRPLQLPAAAHKMIQTIKLKSPS